jgi:acetate kinase
MVATLGGLDALVFTGGIGEHSSAIRSCVAEAFGFLGLYVDQHLNTSGGTDLDIARTDSHARVLVISAREDLVVLHEVKRLLGS